MLSCCFPSQCPFCDVRVENGFKVVFEDEELIAFHDRSPAAKLHVLVIPRKHIRNVKSLDSNHVTLLENMISLGRKLLTENGFDPNDGKQARIGFHVPPFNSVDHLHMHVLGLPFKNSFRKLKYTPGYPWYANAADVLERLRHGMSPV